MDLQPIKTEPKDFENPREICRLCLSQEALEDVSDGEDLHQWISDYLSISVSIGDTISKAICAACRIRVTEFHQFRMRCQEVQIILRSMMVENEELKDNVSNKFPETKPLAKGMPCDVCHKIFRSRKLLTSHKKIHGAKEHICTDCGKSFARRQHLIKHMKIHPNDKDTVKAEPSEATTLKLYEEQEDQPMLGYDFVQNTLAPDSMRQEEVTQTIIKEEYDPAKEDQTVQSSNLDTAQSIKVEEVASSDQLDGEEETNIDNHLQCDICQKTYKLGKTMRAHRKIVHGIKEYLCPICERPFAVRHALKRHLLTHQPIEERQQARPVVDVNDVVRPHKCHICQRAFKRRSKLWDHLKRVHGPRNHECDICGFRFTMRDELKKHIQRHARNGERKEDFRSFHRKQTASTMNVDVKTEATEKRKDSKVDASSTIQNDQKQNAPQAECKECQKVFKSEKYLWLHYKWTHNPKIIKCSVCNIAYMTNKRLERHMLTKHSQEDSNQPLNCPICNKIFSNKAQLARHTLNHGPRRYCCSVCNKTFSILKSFESHMKCHEDSPPISEKRKSLRKKHSSASACQKDDSKNHRQKPKPEASPEETVELVVIKQEIGGASERVGGPSFQETTIKFEAEEYKIEPQ